MTGGDVIHNVPMKIRMTIIIIMTREAYQKKPRIAQVNAVKVDAMPGSNIFQIDL